MRAKGRGTHWLKPLLEFSPRLREMPYIGLWLSQVTFDSYFSVYYIALQVGMRGIPLAWTFSRIPDLRAIPMEKQSRLIDKCARAMPTADRPVLLRGCEPCSVGLVTHIQGQGWSFELPIPPDTMALFAPGGSMPVREIPVTVGTTVKMDKVCLRDAQSSAVVDLVVTRPDTKPARYVVTNMPIDCLQLAWESSVANGHVYLPLDHEV